METIEISKEKLESRLKEAEEFMVRESGNPRMETIWNYYKGQAFLINKILKNEI